MKNWVLTGGVGCGKSLVGKIISNHLLEQVWSFSSDQVIALSMNDPVMIERLGNEFGNQVVLVDEGGFGINKSVLRDLVFADRSLLQKLEAILHPLVLNELNSRRAEMDALGKELFLAEVPLHYEIGETVTADLIIVVAASRAMQVRRLMERRGLEEPIIEQILRSQWPIEAKVEKADVVIWNDGDETALEAQVLTLLRQHWHDTIHRNN